MLATGFELLVGGPEFWRRARAEIEAAERSVLVQTLSFESDRAGRALTSALLRSPAADRRLVVDCFNECFHSDHFLLAPRSLLDRRLQREVKGTRRMTGRLRRGGVEVRSVNPTGFLWHRIADRNHKKVIAVDGQAAYVGGINFSEHNFAWHDVMLRIGSRGAIEYLAGDFEATWRGRAGPWHYGEPGLDVYNLPGPGNHLAVQPVLRRIAASRRSVWVESPYLSSPFTDAMAEARAHGARVTVVTPEVNNRSFQTAYITAQARRYGFELRARRGGMSHLKAMLLDDQVLVLGSSNFDWPSSDRLPEFVVFVSEPALLADFRARVLLPDLDQSDVLLPAGAPRDGPPTPAEREVALYRRLAKLSCGGEYGLFRPNGSSGA
jgi:cardiolipin synthase